MGSQRRFMSMDILILNTAVADFRSCGFGFVEKLAGKGGLDGLDVNGRFFYDRWTCKFGAG